MQSTFDSVVVGAGIVGTACAFELARCGMRVALVDASDPGLGATAAGMGHIVVMDDSAAQFRLTQYSRQLWNEIGSGLPESCEFRRTGTLWIATDEEEMDEAARKRSFYATHDVDSRLLSAQELRDAEPSLREGLAGALQVPDDAVVYAPNVARVLAARARDNGAVIMKEKVAEMGSGTVTLGSGKMLRSHRIVNAAGEWAGTLTRGLPIRKRKGNLVITDRYSGMVAHQLVELGYLKSAHAIAEDSVAFNVQPRSTGQLLIGSSRQFEAEGSAVDHEILSQMLLRAISYMPCLRDLSVLRVWSGYRAATPDKLPLIGPWQEDNTVYLATGHEGLGIATSLGTARLLAEVLDGREPAIPLAPYLPNRMTGEVTCV
jgi:glycine/D-amino acid oxidase-like deaminating enzyme